MPTGRPLPISASAVAHANEFLRSLRRTQTSSEIVVLMDAIAHDMGFRHFALIHHTDLRVDRPGQVKIMNYPAGVSERIIDQRRYRRDPIIRGCLFADSAFLWSDLHHIIRMDQYDRASFDFGMREGLNEGITVPCSLLGDRMGSCTFAGTRKPHRASRYLGPAQMIGVFAFQAGRRLAAAPRRASDDKLRLHPRPRDCIVLAGQGLSNKEIARALSLTPRTVDGYMTEARQLFSVHDRTELVISAILAGEVGLDELVRRQPE